MNARPLLNWRGASAGTSDMRADGSVRLGEQDQDHLIRAIEAAIEVGRQDQFQAWLRGPFRTLLPHENVVFMELAAHGATQPVQCLHHNLVDAVRLDLLCEPQHGLAARLVRAYGGKKQVSWTIDAQAIAALLQGSPSDAGQFHNALLHRTRLLSGTAYCLLLVNVPPERIARYPQLLKLLSSHLKMALSRALVAPESRKIEPLTQRELEIVHWMREDKSNREISIILGISAITLKSHVSKIYRKLDVQNRAAALARALHLTNTSA
jgi:DNA-binding CsgD family transcriptional regulator